MFKDLKKHTKFTKKKPEWIFENCSQTGVQSKK